MHSYSARIGNLKRMIFPLQYVGAVTKNKGTVQRRLNKLPGLRSRSANRCRDTVEGQVAALTCDRGMIERVSIRMLDELRALKAPVGPTGEAGGLRHFGRPLPGVRYGPFHFLTGGVILMAAGLAVKGKGLSL